MVPGNTCFGVWAYISGDASRASMPRLSENIRVFTNPSQTNPSSAHSLTAFILTRGERARARSRAREKAKSKMVIPISD